MSVKYYGNTEHQGGKFCLPGDGKSERASQKKGCGRFEETENREWVNEVILVASNENRLVSLNKKDPGL